MKNQKRNWIVILIFLLYPMLIALSRVMADPYAGPDSDTPTSVQATSLGTGTDSSGGRWVGDQFSSNYSSTGQFIQAMSGYEPMPGEGSADPSIKSVDPLGN